MIKYICDKCGKEYQRELLRADISSRAITLNLCCRCFFVYGNLKYEADEKFLNSDIEELTIDGKEHNLVYESYSQHDCEAWYHCPICGESYSSWGFFNKEMKPGDKFKCNGCKNTLIVPR
jgi:transposase-like protein